MARYRRLPVRPAIDERGPGVWFSVASVHHPNYPPGALMSGPQTSFNAGRAPRGVALQKWKDARFYKGFIDKFMLDITPEEFNAEFVMKLHSIEGCGDISKRHYPKVTRLEASNKKVLTGDKTRNMALFRESMQEVLLWES